MIKLIGRYIDDIFGILLIFMLGCMIGLTLCVDEMIVQNLESTSPQTVEIKIISETNTPVEIERKTYLGEFKVSAYCACSVCCGEWADGLTYTGTVATERQTIAVDPDVIPLGSIVEIDGNKYIAEDIGGAIKDKRIDMYFSSHDEAKKYGVQYHDVYLML